MANDKEKTREVVITNGIDVLLGEGYRDERRDGPWNKLNDAPAAKDLEPELQKELLRNARDMYFRTPEARSLINSITFYVIGKGISYHAEDENPAAQEYIDAFWKSPKNRMELRQKEIVKRVLRDGEAFLRFFTDTATSMTYVRFVEPDQITSIKYDPDDAETPISYHREWIPEGSTDSKAKEEDIPAEDIIHIKDSDMDLNMRRGRSKLEPCMKRLVQYDHFVEGRVKRNRLTAGFILEKVLKGEAATSEAVSSVAGGMSDATKDDGVATASKKMPKFGSVVVHNDSIEYKWLSPEIKADDCSEDGRLIRLSICAALNAPEYMLGDASNANYASTMVTENPFVRMCEDLQDTFKEYYKAIFAKVIERGIKYGKLPSMSNETRLKESWKNAPLKKAIRWIREQLGDDMAGKQKLPVPTKKTVTVEFPIMTHRDLKAETDSYQVHSAMGWASDRTLSNKLGYDYDAEWLEIEKARERNLASQPDADFKAAVDNNKDEDEDDEDGEE